MIVGHLANCLFVDLVENLEHCDFQALRNLLIRHYMLDLLETTNNVHYENYRCRKLTGIAPGPDGHLLGGKDTNKYVVFARLLLLLFYPLCPLFVYVSSIYLSLSIYLSNLSHPKCV